MPDAPAQIRASRVGTPDSDPTGLYAWTAGDAATLSVTGNALATITALAAGTSTVTVASGSDTVDVPVEITQYTVAERQAGEALHAAAACGGCHADGAEGDITSSGFAEHTAAEILAAIVDGTNPEGDVIEGGHTYPTTGDETKGIIVCLRSLPPLGEPSADE